MRKEKILILVNGNKNIGFGHISRMLILASEYVKSSTSCDFLIVENCPFSDIIEKASFNVLKVDNFENKFEIANILNERNYTMIIIDLVEREYLLFRWLRLAFPTIFLVSFTLFLFDIKNRYENISFFPNMSLVCEREYGTEFGCFTLFAGPNYFTFRKEFDEIHKTIKKNAHNILVTMGGADPFCITTHVIKSLLNVEGLNIKIILSEISNSYQQVVDLISKHSKLNIELKNYTDSISNDMLSADLLVINGGLTRYEACRTLTPFVAIGINKTQVAITEELTKLGVGINLGVYNELSQLEIKNSILNLLNDFSLRKKISSKMCKLFNQKNSAKLIIEKIRKKEFDFEESNR